MSQPDPSFDPQDFQARFSDWIKEITPEMRVIAGLLTTKLSNEPTDLYDEISVLDSHKHRVSERCSEAEEWLSIAKEFYLADHKDEKENDKKVHLEADVSSIKKVFKRLDYMRDDIEGKIDWGRSALAYQRELTIRTTGRPYEGR